MVGENPTVRRGSTTSVDRERREILPDLHVPPLDAAARIQAGWARGENQRRDARKLPRESSSWRFWLSDDLRTFLGSTRLDNVMLHTTRQGFRGGHGIPNACV